MADVEKVEVVVAHNERATLRVGDVFKRNPVRRPLDAHSSYRLRASCGDHKDGRREWP
jgi:hypothetical protein